MKRLEPRWPRVRPLGVLLQSPAHRVMRVLHVTQSHWQLPERRGDRRRAVPAASVPPPTVPMARAPRAHVFAAVTAA